MLIRLSYLFWCAASGGVIGHFIKPAGATFFIALIALCAFNFCLYYFFLSNYTQD